MMSNRHPVDELADVRAEVRRLKAREDEPRELILSGRCDPVGDQHEATVREAEAERIDTAALKRELGFERLRPFMRQSVVRTVLVAERAVPDDL